MIAEKKYNQLYTLSNMADKQVVLGPCNERADWLSGYGKRLLRNFSLVSFLRPPADKNIQCLQTLTCDKPVILNRILNRISVPSNANRDTQSCK